MAPRHLARASLVLAAIAVAVAVAPAAAPNAAGAPAATAGRALQASTPPSPSPTGLPYKITTIAGTAATQTSGDGDPATIASFNEPQGIAADSAGMIYVSEKDGHRVRRIDLAGNISTWVGTVALPGVAGMGAEGGAYCGNCSC